MYPNEIKPRKVKILLKEINPKKSNGPDGIHPSVLNKLSKELAEPLTRKFKSSILFGEVRNDWKITNVTRIYKKGSKQVPKNYRPVSLTSQVCRVFERVIKEEMVNYFEINNLLGPSPHGFRKNRSEERRVGKECC